MFDGWFCFGGTEIVNSARAVGYARTASQIVNFDEPPTPGVPAVILATNIATDPSFEIPAAAVTLRRNLIRYSDTSSATGWLAASGTVVAENGRLKYTQNATSPVRLGGRTVMSPVKGAGTYVASFRAQTSDPSITGARAFLYDSVTSTTRALVSVPLVPGGGENRYDFTLVSAGDFDNVYMEFYGTAIPTGAIGYISEPMLELSSVQGAFFNGQTRPAVRKNIALNPRGTSGGAAGWFPNNGAINPLVRGVTPPVPHPLGIATAVKQMSTGTNNALGSMYNIDGLGITGTSARSVGHWMLVNEPGYSAYGVSLPALTWTFVRQSSPVLAGAFSSLFVTKDVGNASTTAELYVTGLIVEEGVTPVGGFFDGSYPAPAGYVNAWKGAVDASASYRYDNDFSVSWTGAAAASEAILTAAGAPTPIVGLPWGSDGTDFTIQSSHWAHSGSKSARLISRSTSANSYQILTISSLPAGEYTLVLPVRLAAAQGSPGALARTVEYRVDGVAVETAGPFPNSAGEHELRLRFTKESTVGSHVIAINHGVAVGGADLWMDDFTLVAEPYSGPAFTGDTQDADGVEFRWTGAANASTSRMMLPATDAVRQNYCDINWFTWGKEECYQNLWTALDNTTTYEAENIPEDAPWYSAASGYNYPSTPSRKFLGVYALSVSALSDSTRDVNSTEGIRNGGVLGRERLAMPRFRFRVMLTAVDEEGLEYGKAWLSKALAERACSTHGASCGSSDLTFFVACPTAPDYNGPTSAYEEKLDSLTRMYHDVKCVAGPVETDRYQRPENSWGMIVEFTLAAGVANMFGLPAPYLDISQDGETIIQDIPLNLIPYPSAELSGADVTVATNYSTNPSVETNATGWSTEVDGTNITSGMITSGRVTGELQAVGTASFRTVFTATGAGVNGYFSAQQEVDLSSRPAGSAPSINFWAAEALISGSPVRPDIEMFALWRSSSGGTVLRTDSLGAVPVSGGSISAKSIIPPAGATHVLIRARARLTSWPAGTVVRLYADALAVTVP